MRLLILLGFAFWMVACTPSGKQTSSKEALSSDSIQYAQGFTVQRFDTYIMVEVRDPWDSTRLLQRYLLVDRTKSVPGGLPKGTIVKVPVKDIVIYTSVHAAIIDQLHETDKVIGVCEPRYMDTPAIQEGIQAGRIADLGEWRGFARIVTVSSLNGLPSAAATSGNRKRTSASEYSGRYCNSQHRITSGTRRCLGSLGW